MYLVIIVLPLLGSIVSGFFGRKIGVSGSQIITCSSVIITTLLAIIAFLEVGLNNIPVSLYLFRWIDSESLNVFWSFNFDSLTVSMLIPVLIVSSLVHIYSIGYMSHDPHNQRFFSYLSLFTFMMIILVTANNFLLMFVGWEGVGICSYLLVSFWYTRIAANQSSISAFLTNRVGDCFLTIGMFAILWSFGNIDYNTVFILAPYFSENIVTIIGICLLIGAMAKSSQIGLHVWLPMAMEGPTPVSALIHAATMVTAGVYLLMRTSPLIEYSSTVLILCLWIGAITTVFSSLIGLFQQDIKKVIAYSTMSQLGMMVIAIGLSSYNIALFHLVNHAFYKALLFLGAGAVIHAVGDNQDFRKYGGLKQFLPLTYSVILIASLSLVAFPFMTGFYSKDFILESAYGQFYFSSITVYFIATIGAMFTTLYSVKVLYLTFITNPNGPLTSYKNAHEGDIFMSLPLIILAIFSIFFGYITKDIFIGLGSAFFLDNSIFIHPTHEIMLDTEFAVITLYKLLPLFFTISLSVLSLILSEYLYKLLINFKFSKSGYNLFSFFNQRFLIEFFYNKYITNVILKLGGHTTKILDKGSIELLGPYGLEKGLTTLSRNLSSLDTGIVTTYALYILLGLIFYILIPYLSVINISLLFLILFSLFVNINFNVNNPYNHNYDYKTLHSNMFIIDTKYIYIRLMACFNSDFFNLFTLDTLYSILNDIYRLIIGSIKLRIFIGLINIFLLCLNLGTDVFNMIVIILIISSYTYSICIANKKIHKIIKIFVNLIILCVFWKIVYMLVGMDLLFYIGLGLLNNYSLEFWDLGLGEKIAALNLPNFFESKEVSGGPGGQGGGGPSGPFDNFSLHTLSSEDETEKMKDIGWLKYYNKFIVIDGKIYPTKYMQNLIKTHNDNINYNISEDIDLEEEKKLFLAIQKDGPYDKKYKGFPYEHCYRELYSAILNITVASPFYDFKSLDKCKQELDEFNKEYYILSKGMKYFEKKALILNMEDNLSKGSYNEKFLIKSMKNELNNSIGKKAFEFWQKRQLTEISFRLEELTKGNIKGNSFIPDFFNESSVYIEMVNDFTYVSIHLLQLNNAINEIDKYNKNMGLTIDQLSLLDRVAVQKIYLRINTEFSKGPFIKEAFENHEYISKCSLLAKVNIPHILSYLAIEKNLYKEVHLDIENKSRLVKYNPLIFQDMSKISKHMPKFKSIFDCIRHDHKDLNINKVGLEVAKNFSMHRK